jgi:hypothetical protein
MANKVIHIHAKCDAFEIWEHIAESKAYSRLLNIRKAFVQYQSSKGHQYTGSLVVNIVVVNPTLF